MVTAGDVKPGSLSGFQVVRLVESYRMRRDNPDGRNVYTVAQAIDAGLIVPFTAARDGDEAIIERGSVAEVAFQGVEFLAATSTILVDEYLGHWYRQKLALPRDLVELASRRYALATDGFDDDDKEALDKLFAHRERHRILCVTRVSPPTGADRINQALHVLALNERNSAERARNPLDFGNEAHDELVPGEPVMMQVNDYQRMLFNGDQGLVLNVADTHRTRRMVVFPRSSRYVAFSLDSMRPMLRLSYAMTVHKSQGSEFDGITLFLPDQDLPINTREILYTALTRGRKSVVIVGDRNIWKAGVSRSLHRDSGIIEKLCSLAGPPG
jgi:exodeoxyribonuclease V alpha subunit